MFYLVCKDLNQRTALIEQLKTHNIMAVFHYISLHTSPFYIGKHDGRALANTDHFSDCLVRLPLFYELNEKEVLDKIILD
jgi:dTDP-4-amino-4,6-dideoxygalactose transaminase